MSKTPSPHFPKMIDGARFVRYDENRQTLWIWRGGTTINLYGWPSGEECGSFSLSEAPSVKQVIVEIDSRIANA